MNAISDLATVNKFARALEDTEARKFGIRTAEARHRVASRLGISPGTFENIRRLRTKIVPNWLMNKVRAEFIAVLQNEIQRLQHEIDIARHAGSDHCDDVLDAAQTQLVAAKETLRAADLASYKAGHVWTRSDNGEVRR